MSSYLAFNNPLERPLHFLGLELMFVACFALTLVDARRAWRAGDRFIAFQWLAAFSYGILMELIAYNFIDNFWHARFTVQLYHNKLPLYVVCLYPVFLYTGLRVAQRWRLGALPEALLAGLAIALIDMPFDIAGVDAGWWSWSDKDPNIAVRWLGVPVTSYYWYLLFGAVYSLLCRALRSRLEKRHMWQFVALSPLVGGAVIFFGTLSFLPFHGLKALGVHDGWVVGAHLAGCAVLALWIRPRAIGPSLRPLFWVPLLLAAWHVGLLLVLPHVPRQHLKLAVALAATAGVLRLLLPNSPDSIVAATLKEAS